MIAWVFFRAPSVSDAILYLNGLFDISIFTIPENLNEWILTLVFILALVVVEWLQREKEHALELYNTKMSKQLRWSFYLIIFFIIFWYGGTQQDFIYFQF